MVACVTEGFRHAERAALWFSVVFNVTLCFLILRHTTPALRCYSRILLCTCCIDLLFTFSSFVNEIHPDIRDGLVVIVSVGYDFGVHKIFVLCFYLFTMYFAIAAVCVGMIYRYFAVCRDRILTAYHIAGLYAAIITASAMVALSTYLTYLPVMEQTEREFARRIEAYHCHDPVEMHIARLDDKRHVAPPMVVAGVFISTAYTVVVLSVYKIRRSIQQLAVGHNNIATQSQAQLALTAQAIVPLVLIVVPLCGSIVVVGLGVEELRIQVLSSTSFLSWVPVANPLCTMFFITPYRRALVKYTENMVVCDAAVHPSVGAIQSQLSS